MRGYALISAVILVASALSSSGRRFGPHKISVVCENGQEICGTKCYSPATETCFEHKNGWGKQACPKNEQLCGWDCYTPGEKICMNQEGRFEVLCNPGESACSGRCYTPETQVCLEDDYLCEKGEEICGITCYQPSEDQKCIQGNYGSRLCKAGEDVCGSWGCYSPEEKKCFPDEDVLCKTGEELCGYKCYNKANGDTCHNEQTVCKAGEQLCDSECYSEANGQVCLNEKKVCKVGESICGDYNCYSPDNGEQCFEARADYHVVCGKGLNYCWYDCYDSATDTCLEADESGSDSYRMVCKKGEEICMGALSPYSSGYGCFNPEEKACLKGTYGKVLCTKDESVCGNGCYNAEDLNQVCIGGKVCQPGQEVCGGRCYNPEHQSCFRDIETGISYGR